MTGRLWGGGHSWVHTYKNSCKTFEKVATHWQISQQLVLSPQLLLNRNHQTNGFLQALSCPHQRAHSKATLLSAILNKLGATGGDFWMVQAATRRTLQVKNKLTVYWHKLTQYAKVPASRAANPTQNLTHCAASTQRSSYRKTRAQHNSLWHQCVWALCDHKCAVIDASCSHHQQLIWPRHHKGLIKICENFTGMKHQRSYATKCSRINRLATTWLMKFSHRHKKGAAKEASLM